jgi:hypothetical protein
MGRPSKEEAEKKEPVKEVEKIVVKKEEEVKEPYWKTRGK